MIKNPRFKGKWTTPLIPNLKFKGEWKARQIKNSKYFQDKQPAAFSPVDAVAFELWTVQDGILFDNILLSTSEQYARDFALKTWGAKHEKERAAQIKAAKDGLGLQEKDDDGKTGDFEANTKRPLKETFMDVWEEVVWYSRRFRRNPIKAVRSDPLLTMNLLVAFLIIASALQKLISKLLPRQAAIKKADEPLAAMPVVESSAPLNPPTSSSTTISSTLSSSKIPTPSKAVRQRKN